MISLNHPIHLRKIHTKYFKKEINVSVNFKIPEKHRLIFFKKKVLHASVMTDMKKNLESQFLSSPCFLTLISLGRIVQKAMDAKKKL